MNEEAGFKEDNFLIIVKLFVYFGLNVIGVATALYGYLVKPFSKTRLLVGCGSALYLLLSGLWTLLLQFRIVGTLYRGRNKDGKVIWLRSKMDYPAAIYRVQVLKPKSRQIIEEIEFSVGDWLDVDGFVVGKAVHSGLKDKLVPKMKFE